MSGKITKKALARIDLIDHFDYLGQHNVAAAHQFLEAAEKAFEQLVNMPEMGSRIESRDPRLAGVRVWPIHAFEKFLVFYRPIENGVEILRVLHGSRDIHNLFEM